MPTNQEQVSVGFTTHLRKHYKTKQTSVLQINTTYHMSCLCLSSLVCQSWRYWSLDPLEWKLISDLSYFRGNAVIRQHLQIRQSADELTTVHTMVTVYYECPEQVSMTYFIASLLELVLHEKQHMKRKNGYLAQHSKLNTEAREAAGMIAVQCYIEREISGITMHIISAWRCLPHCIWCGVCFPDKQTLRSWRVCDVPQQDPRHITQEEGKGNVCVFLSACLCKISLNPLY